jgi:hypothetical protein
MACTGCPALGVYTKILLEDGDADYTFDDESTRLEILDEGGENIRKHGRIIGGQGIIGKHYRLKNRKRFGGHFIFGTIVLNPSAAYFDALLKYMLGPDTDDDTVFVPEPCLYPFGLLMSRDLGHPWEYQDGVVSGWRLSSQGIEFREQGEPDLLRLEIDMVFKDEKRSNNWPETLPDLGIGTSYEPYIYDDCNGAFTLKDAVREVYQFQLEYSNMLSIRYANSLTPSSICSTGRMLRLGVVLPWDSTNEDLYEQSHEGFAAQIKFTHGVEATGIHSTQIDIHNLTVPPQSPYTANRREIWFENNGEGYGDAETDTPELKITNVIGEPAPPP